MGALTIKPYAFTYRPWEIEKIPITNVLSMFPEIIILHFKNQEVMRITSASNSDFLSNNLRFSTSSINNFFFPKNNVNFKVSSVLHDIVITLFSFFVYFNFKLQLFIVKNKNLNKLIWMFKALFCFKHCFYKNIFNLNYIFPNLQKKIINSMVTFFNNSNYANLLVNNNSKTQNNLIVSNCNLYSIFNDINSNVYLSTDIHLRENALEFYLNICKLVSLSINIVIFYISKIKNIIETKQKNVIEYQLGMRFFNKTLLFFTHSLTYLSTFYFFFSNKIKYGSVYFPLKSPLTYSLDWMYIKTPYFESLNYFKYKNKKEILNLHDFYSLPVNKGYSSFLNIFSVVLKLQNQNAVL